ncbi:hypothetical protein AB5N19_07608 [Seiridium cardinale]
MVADLEQPTAFQESWATLWPPLARQRSAFPHEDSPPVKLCGVGERLPIRTCVQTENRDDVDDLREAFPVDRESRAQVEEYEIRLGRQIVPIRLPRSPDKGVGARSALGAGDSPLETLLTTNAKLESRK